jgi:hypothetical protein
MNTKFPFTKVFPHTGEDFSANSAAEKWLKENGFSIGTMCAPEPRAILHGNTYIPKWKNLSSEDREEVDGVAKATNWRTGDVTVYLKFDPVSKS